MNMKKILSLLVMLASFNSVFAIDYISEIYVYANTDKSLAKSQLERFGYTIVKTSTGEIADLNHGGGGHYIYLGYKTTTDKKNAITGLAILKGVEWSGENNTQPLVFADGKVYYPVKYSNESNGGNLNRGRGAAASDLYLYYTRSNATNTDQSVITGLTVDYLTENPWKNTNLSYVMLAKKYALGYETSGGPQDLNENGSAKSMVFLRFTTHTCSAAYTYTDSSHKLTCRTCGYEYENMVHTYSGSPRKELNDESCYVECKCGHRELYKHSYYARDVKNNGENHYIPCEYCGHKKYEEHSYGPWQNNNVIHYRGCVLCGQQQRGDHEMEYQDINQPAMHNKICSICEYRVSESHTQVTDAPEVPSTCTVAGHTKEWHCADCGYKGEVYPLALGSHHLSIKYGQPATCVSSGYDKYRECDDCHKLFDYDAWRTEIQAPPVLQPNNNHDGHLKLNQGITATCKTEGLERHYYCDACKRYYLNVTDPDAVSYDALIIPKLTIHTYLDADGWCMQCGEYGGSDYSVRTLVKTIQSMKLNGKRTKTDVEMMVDKILGR